MNENYSLNCSPNAKPSNDSTITSHVELFPLKENGKKNQFDCPFCHQQVATRRCSLTSVRYHSPTALGNHLKHAQLVDVVLSDETVRREFQVFASWSFAHLGNQNVLLAPDLSKLLVKIPTYDVFIAWNLLQSIDDLLQPVYIG